jgi:uncharacterized repeat protein (TIGR01451 family)
VPAPKDPPTGRPPAFKLVDPPAGPDTRPKPPPPIAAVEALPPGTAATPCLALARTGPAQVKARQPFAYDITVRNVGSVPARQARLEEELPPGTRLIAAQPMPVQQGDRLSWNLENLAPGAEVCFHVEVEANSDGDWSAQAILTVSVASVLQTHVAGASPRLIELGGPPAVRVGQQVLLPIRVTNPTGAPLTDLILRVHLSAGLQHLQGDAIEGALGDLAAGQSKSLTLDAIAVQPGNLGARVTLLSGKKPLADAAVTVQATEQPVLALHLTEPPSLPSGSEEDYRVEVVNRSGAAVREVVVRNVLPRQLRYVSGDAGASYDPATHTVRWNVGTLAPQQGRLMIFRAAALSPGPQLNHVTVQAAGGQDAELYTILRVAPLVPR